MGLQPQSTISMTTDFIDGWRKLPDEVKLRVVSLALPSGVALVADVFVPSLQHQFPPCFRSRKSYPAKDFKMFEKEVLPLLACPEVACMAYECFYKQNQVCMRSEMWSGAFYFPPTKLSPFVRHLFMQINPDRLVQLKFLPKIHPKTVKVQRDFGFKLLPLLACPELSALAYKTFYKQNTTLITAYQPFLPPALPMSYIRHVRICVDPTYPRGLEAVINLGSAKLAANFCRVDVELYGRSMSRIPGYSQDLLNQLDTVEIPTRVLSVLFQRGDYNDYPAGVANVESHLLNKLSIRPSDKEINVRWDQYTIETPTTLGSYRTSARFKKHHVSTWKGHVWVNDHERYTEKTIWQGTGVGPVSVFPEEGPIEELPSFSGRY